MPHQSSFVPRDPPLHEVGHETRRRLLPSLNKVIFRVGSVGFGTIRRSPIPFRSRFAAGRHQRSEGICRIRRTPRLRQSRTAPARRVDRPRTPRRARGDHRAHGPSVAHEWMVPGCRQPRLDSSDSSGRAALPRDRDPAGSRCRFERPASLRRGHCPRSFREARRDRRHASQGWLLGSPGGDRARTYRSLRPRRLRHVRGASVLGLRDSLHVRSRR